MGGRGSLSLTTGGRKSGLTRRIANLDEKIAAIDKAAQDYSEEVFADSLKRNTSTGFWTQEQAWEFAEEDARMAIAEYALDNGRAELVRERAKYREELRRLKAGQNTLFG